MKHPLRFTLFIIFLCLFESVVSQISSRVVTLILPTKFVDLPIYQPTKKAIEVLNQVLNSDNPNIPDTDCGIFQISKINSNLLISYSSQETWNLIDKYHWQDYSGCVIFGNKIFLLHRKLFADNNFNDLFVKSNGFIYFGVMNFLLTKSFDPTWIFTTDKGEYFFKRIEFSDGLIQDHLNLEEFE